jgi:sporulation protein YlmC with PRC-barrel domain
MRTTSYLVFAAFTAAFLWSFADAARADDPANRGSEAKVNIAHILRSGDIIGLSVQNKAGEHLGKIDDLVIDMKSGDVRYAALSHGGVAGIGSKLFAVPWQAMTFVLGEPNKPNSRHFVFDKTNDQLDNAPSFDSSHWPNVADPKWAESVDKHYNVSRQDVKRQEEPSPKSTEGERQTVAYETVFRASKIKGMDVRNNANEHLGSIDEIVLDVTKGHVEYLALSFGSVFTGGNKLFAVPLSSCTLNHANDKTFITLHVSQDQLRNAPGFDKNNWPDMADPNWKKENDAFYQRTAQRTTTIQK